MKKLIAIVLSVAMMLTVCAFSVSAEGATPTLYIVGPANTQVGDQYTINVRLADADDQVGGFQGEIAYTGATVVSSAVNPQVLGFNNTNDEETVINDDVAGVVKFVTVADLDGKNPAERIWFKVTFEITESNPTFTLQNVIFSDRDAKVLSGNCASSLAPKVPEEGEPVVMLKDVGMLPEVEPMNQGILVKATIDTNGKDVDAYGVVFYPTYLLGGEDLTVETEGAAVAQLTKANSNFDDYLDNEDGFQALLRFNFSTEKNAATFLGTTVTARVFYKIGDDVYYSANTVEDSKYIQGGVAKKAVLNTVLDKATEVENNSSTISTENYNDAIKEIATTFENFVENRKTALRYVVENFAA